jgi:hypothetical protein
VTVVHPGRTNRDRGPDFLGAVVSMEDGERLVGDVELHRRAGDWKTHGHHRDARYNGVILQVVWDGEAAAKLESGREAPTLNVSSSLAGSIEDLYRLADSAPRHVGPCHCAHARLGDELGWLIDEAGTERFHLKARSFALQLDREPGSEVLYRGMMGALGYAKNKEAFEQLAALVKFADLEAACWRCLSHEDRVQTVRALLLDAAGLPRDDGGSGWDCGLPGPEDSMSLSSWRRFRVRPENRPVCRIEGAARVIARFMERGGLVTGVLGLLDESASDMRALEAAFMVRSEVSGGGRARSLIGQGRARDIVINVVLPFVSAWAGVSGQHALAGRALTLHNSWPAAADNELTRDMEDLLVGSGKRALAGSARRQQGLIHLAKTYCHRHRCESCPVLQSLDRSVAAVRAD